MKKTLLIGWDAADWKVIGPLIEQGKMPHLARLVERGVMGNLSTLHPVLSPMLWTSIATGKRPFKHGVLGFTEPTPDGAYVQPVSQFSRKTKALWNILNQEGIRASVLGWWPSHPAEPIRGAMVSNHYQTALGPPDRPWPMAPGTVHPPRLIDTLAELRLNPNELAPAQVLPFVPKAAEIDQEKDPRLGTVMKVLAETASIHGAATWLLEHEPWDFFAVYYDAIDHFCHGFMRYHPPRRPHISERDFELYSGVVEAGYRFHDMMLGATLALVPEDTTVVICSDHGFHPDHLRPVQLPNEPAGPAIEHRDFGVFVMAGPGICKDALIHGASLLDITPTLLTHWGLPVGEDMDGKPLLEVFEQTPAVQRIPSWDEVPGEDGRLDAALCVDPLAAKEAMDQLVALGYVEAPSGDRAEAIAQTVRELNYNLARSYMDADLYGQAVPLLRDLYAQSPDQYRFGIQLAMCYRSLGEVQALRELVERLTRERVEAARQAQEKLREMAAALRAEQQTPEGQEPDFTKLDEAAQKAWNDQRMLARFNRFDLDFLMGCVLMDEGRPEEALAHFKQAERVEPERPGLLIQIGEALLKLRRPADAEGVFRKALTIDPVNPHVQLGLARALLPQRRAGEAAHAALETVRLLYNYPLAHYVLGLALVRLLRWEDAEHALRTACAINPNFLAAHRVLVRLYTVILHGKDERLRYHRRLLREIRQARKAGPKAAAAAPQAGLDELAADGAHPAAAPAPEVLAPTAGVDRLPGPEAPAEFITVVAGLPRSGTSMLMQMVDAGGIPALTDGRRVADRDNPRGYFELEAATRLHTDRGWLDEAQGRCVKVVAQLLTALPRGRAYRVLFIERDLEEVLSSQGLMLERLGRTAAKLDRAALKRTYQAQSSRLKAWLAAQPGLYVLYLKHREVIADPAAAAAAIDAFLGGGLDPQAMAAVVDASLYRQRANADHTLAA